MNSPDLVEKTGAAPVPRWVVVLCLLISFAGLFNHDLWTPDEPREAAIALEMSRTGNVLVPHLAGDPFVEKPPLYYAVSAGALKLFGELLGNTRALRLTSALWGLAAIGMTYLLARRLYGRPAAVLVALMLATMPGFVQVTHWLLVDNALLFFVAAALWSAGEAYVGGRPLFLLLTGLFTAGAFLAKGIIGPLFIALGWIGFLPSWFRNPDRRSLWIFPHALALLIFLGLSLGWALAFRAKAGPELFASWFWENHFGRFAGTTTHLGHISGPMYYVNVLPVYTLPWLLALALGLKTAFSELKRRGWPAAILVPLLWGVGGFLLLSAPATKREIYMVVLLPAFAMLALTALARPDEPAWSRAYRAVWTVLCLAVLVALAAAAGGAVVSGKWDEGWLGPWKRPMAVAGVGLVAAVAVYLRRRLTGPARCFAVTAICYVTLLCAVPPVIDEQKSYGPAFEWFGRKLNRVRDLRPVAWRLDETTRAGFYYYTDIIFPVCRDPNVAGRILRGENPRFNAVVACPKGKDAQDPALDAGVVLWQKPLGRRRTLQMWVVP